MSGYVGREDQEPPCHECGGWHVMHVCYECGEIACLNCRCEADDDYEPDAPDLDEAGPQMPGWVP